MSLTYESHPGASRIMETLNSTIESYNAKQKTELMKKNKGLYEIVITDPQVEWTLDLKTKGTLTKGKAPSKPDVSITTDEGTFLAIASGKLVSRVLDFGSQNGQKAFMTGKIKVKGNVGLSSKLLDLLIKLQK